MINDAVFDHLIEEGLAQSMAGWDFSWLNQRTEEEPLPWDYKERVLARLPGVSSLLDVGTGGGEFLSSLSPLPPVTWATEGYPPNVPVARSRLEPVGVHVADVSEISDHHLPFASETFEFIIDRHEGVWASEVGRVLKPGGRYITQQVGGQNCVDLNLFIDGAPTYEYKDYTLEKEVHGLEEAGFRIVDQREAFPLMTFRDIAGVVFYLKIVSWQIPGFTVEKYREKLYQIHQIILEKGGFPVRQHRLLVEAVKP